MLSVPACLRGDTVLDLLFNFWLVRKERAFTVSNTSYVALLLSTQLLPTLPVLLQQALVSQLREQPCDRKGLGFMGPVCGQGLVSICRVE